MKFVNWAREHYQIYLSVSIMLYTILDLILCNSVGNITAMLIVSGFMISILTVNIWTEKKSKEIDESIIMNYLKTKPKIH